VPGVLFLVYKYLRKHRENSLEEALIANAGLGGDSTHRGAVIGAILGITLGQRGLPARWMENLNHNGADDILESQKELKQSIDKFASTAASIDRDVLTAIHLNNTDEKEPESRSNCCMPSSKKKRKDRSTPGSWWSGSIFSISGQVSSSTLQSLRLSQKEKRNGIFPLFKHYPYHPFSFWQPLARESRPF